MLDDASLIVQVERFLSKRFEDNSAHGVSSFQYNEVLHLFPTEHSEIFTELNNGFHYTNIELINIIKTALSNSGFDSTPKLTSGLIPRPLNASAYFYKSAGSLNAESVLYKKTLLLIRLASFMSRADFKIDREEVHVVEEMLNSNHGLSTKEKASLLSKFYYLCDLESILDEREDSFVKASLKKDTIYGVVSEYPPNQQREVINFLIDLIIADGELDKREHSNLKELYRMCDLNARTAIREIELRAKERHILLGSKPETVVFDDDEDLYADDLLSDLLADFE